MANNGCVPSNYNVYLFLIHSTPLTHSLPKPLSHTHSLPLSHPLLPSPSLSLHSTQGIDLCVEGCVRVHHRMREFLTEETTKDGQEKVAEHTQTSAK